MAYTLHNLSLAETKIAAMRNKNLTNKNKVVKYMSVGCIQQDHLLCKKEKTATSNQ